jgi:hypothetical protein
MEEQRLGDAQRGIRRRQRHPTEYQVLSDDATFAPVLHQWTSFYPVVV